MKSFLIILILVSIFSAPFTTFGANECSRQGLAGVNRDQFAQFPKCVSQIYIWSLGVAGMLALLVATAGSFTYMTAAGNAEKAQKGSEMIWAAVIGLALLFGAYLLLNTINPNLVNFSLERGTCIKEGKVLNYQQRGLCESAGGRWYEIADDTRVPAPRQ